MASEPQYEDDDEARELVYTATHTYDGETSGDHMVRVVSPVGVYAEFVGTPGAKLVILTPPGQDYVSPDDEIRLQAHIKYENGDMDARQVTRRAEWASSEKDVATIGTKSSESKGVLKGRAKGQTTVTATFGGLKATRKVQVKNSGSASDLRIDPADGEPQVNKGDELPLRASVSDSDGQTHAVTNKVRWSTSDKEVATVSNSGAVKGISAGTAEITGKYRTEEGKNIMAKLKVTVEAELDGEKSQDQDQDQDQTPEQGEDEGQESPEQDTPENESPEGEDTPEGGEDQNAGNDESEAPSTGGDADESGDEAADGGVEPQS